MASKLEIQDDSAMPENIKRATLVQGGITRLLNTSVELGKSKQIEVLDKYMKKLQTSGYTQKVRLEILKSILKGWENIVKNDQSGKRPLHRSRDFNQEARLKEKSDKKLNWYKGKDGKTFESVLMVPATPGGELKNIIEKKARESSMKVKIVEKAGMKLGSYLKKFDKTNKKEPCQEKDCLICTNTTQISRKCRIPNIVYKISCKECAKAGKSANYFGESSFNGYTRGSQHLEKYRSKNINTQEKSVLRMHAKAQHDDKKVDYKMEIIQTFKGKPLARQVMESIYIIKSKSEDNFPLNTKNEFNQALIVTAKYTKGCH